MEHNLQRTWYTDIKERTRT